MISSVELDEVEFLSACPVSGCVSLVVLSVEDENGGWYFLVGSVE